MKTLLLLIKRNSKLFFKDKGLFFAALITPGILLVLYATFLANVYRDSFLAAIPEGLTVDTALINGCVTGQLISSLLAVSCITVAFCANVLMVQDKVNGAAKDLTVSPIKPSVLALGYYTATLVSTLTVCLTATAVCLLYAAGTAWYMTAADVVMLFLDVLLLVLFGTALSSVIHFFLRSQGQISAVSTLVSSCYGFICGAYMPISQFSPALQKIISFLPGTYGTALVRFHTLRGAFAAMEKEGVPAELIEGMKDTIDYNLYFFGDKVSLPVMYAILCGTVLLLVGAYVLLHSAKHRKS